MPSPAFLPVHVLAAEIAARRLSPVDLVDEYLARVDLGYAWMTLPAAGAFTDRRDSPF